MPRASKAIDAAKQLGRKVAAGGGKPAKAAAEAEADPSKAAGKATKAAKPARKSGSSSKASAGAQQVEKRAEKTMEKTTKSTKRPKVDGAGDDKFLEEQRALLEDERVTYLEQAADLKAEADQLAQEMEPGDIQFDDESGEGGTAAVDRERDLALSAQARIEVDEIDHALAKLANGSYGVCEGCGQPIPRARLKALPHARLCVSCKSGGLSRR